MKFAIKNGMFLWYRTGGFNFIAATRFQDIKINGEDLYLFLSPTGGEGGFAPVGFPVGVISVGKQIDRGDHSGALPYVLRNAVDDIRRQYIAPLSDAQFEEATLREAMANELIHAFHNKFGLARAEVAEEMASNLGSLYVVPHMFLEKLGYFVAQGGNYGLAASKTLDAVYEEAVNQGFIKGMVIKGVTDQRYFNDRQLSMDRHKAAAEQITEIGKLRSDTIARLAEDVFKRIFHMPPIVKYFNFTRDGVVKKDQAMRAWEVADAVPGDRGQERTLASPTEFRTGDIIKAMAEMPYAIEGIDSANLELLALANKISPLIIKEFRTLELRHQVIIRDADNMSVEGRIKLAYERAEGIERTKRFDFTLLNQYAFGKGVWTREGFRTGKAESSIPFLNIEFKGYVLDDALEVLRGIERFLQGNLIELQQKIGNQEDLRGYLYDLLMTLNGVDGVRISGDEFIIKSPVKQPDGTIRAIKNITLVTDMAMNDTQVNAAPGGIDSNTSGVELQVDSNGRPIDLGDPAQWQNVQINGHYPVILNISRAGSLARLLGLSGP